MVEYIERDKAKEEILSWAVVINRPQNLSTEDTLCVLDSIPAADVAPVRHGRRIDVPYVYFGLKQYVCDQCADDEFWRSRFITINDKYCPNCGAKLDLDEDGNAQG